MELSDFAEIRRHLHQHPELSGEEYKTAQYIEDKLRIFHPALEKEQIDQNLIFTIGKLEFGKKHIAFRCELDALPIDETNDFQYASVTPGVSHKCGHDGHMSILLRLAYLLKEKPIPNISISLIFQSAEENGKGARQVVNQSVLFDKNRPDYIFALHNVPGYDLSSIIIKGGVFTPSVISVKVYFYGKTSHAAEPEKGINPTFPIAEFLLKARERAEKAGPKHPIILAPIELKIGKEAYGTSAGQGMIGLTLRSISPESLDEYKSWFQDNIIEACRIHNLDFSLKWFECFDAVHNNRKATDIIKNAVNKESLTMVTKEEPFNWGEDFGAYTKMVPGAMFGIGSGKDHAALHHPDYDFPDELIKPGSEMFYSIIKYLADD
jgi:amidohydrolase